MRTNIKLYQTKVEKQRKERIECLSKMSKEEYIEHILQIES